MAFADHVSVHTHGRVQLDDVWFHGSGKDKFGDGLATSNTESSKFASGASIRRANLFFNGDLGHDLGYYVRLDFARNTDGGADYDRVRVQKAALKYHYNDVKFAIGQIYVPFGMEWSTSGSDGLFMERSLASNLMNRNYFGVSAKTHGDMWTVSGAVVQKAFGGSVGRDDTEATDQNDKYGLLARVTFANVDGDNAYHLGLNGKYKSLNVDSAGVANVTTWTAGPELRSRQSATGILTTGGSAATTKYNNMGIELAGKWGAFHAQAEYFRLKAKYDGADSQSYKGWYLQGGWLWTGESRPYNFEKGVFEKPVANDSCGAWELAVRYSRLNLENDAVTASTATADTGKANALTFGVNWYLNNHVTFQANYNQTKFKFKNATDNRKAKGLGVRAQFEF